MAYKRIQKELKDLKQNLTGDFDGGPHEGDQFHWKAWVKAPENTPYQAGTFHMDINFPADYPFRPPKALFSTKIYHPNVSSTGSISLWILHADWSPALTISKVLV